MEELHVDREALDVGEEREQAAGPQPLIPPASWGDTRLILPASGWTDALGSGNIDAKHIPAGRLFAALPIALLRVT
ncbi:MAG TPA: hypothetical protein PLS29_07725 [Acidimicrobiales bacterium]|nr:hypothetical protein [Acidimicrobiales bacterium]